MPASVPLCRSLMVYGYKVLKVPDVVPCLFFENWHFRDLVGRLQEHAVENWRVN